MGLLVQTGNNAFNCAILKLHFKLTPVCCVSTQVSSTAEEIVNYQENLLDQIQVLNYLGHLTIIEAK